MSVRVMTLVWDGAPEANGTDLLILLALADWCNDEGKCWPSVPSLAIKTRVSERTVRYALGRLKHYGYVRCEEHRGLHHTNEYWLDLQVLGSTKPAKNDNQNLQVATQNLQPEVSKPASGDTKPAIAVAAKPSIEPSSITIIEPSVYAHTRLREAIATQTTPTVFASVDDGVDTFWQKYPQTRRGRKPELRLFVRGLRDFTPQKWEAVMLALENYLDSSDVRRGVIMNAMKFLDGEWENYETKPPEPKPTPTAAQAGRDYLHEVAAQARAYRESMGRGATNGHTGMDEIPTTRVYKPNGLDSGGHGIGISPPSRYAK